MKPVTDAGNRGQLYYHLSTKNMGPVVQMEPDGFYERILDSGDPEIITEDGKSSCMRSATPEICFASWVPGAFLAIASALQCRTYYLYQTSERPDVDLTESKWCDFRATGEVRFRRRIRAELIGRIKVDQELQWFVQAVQRQCLVDSLTFRSDEAVHYLRQMEQRGMFRFQEPRASQRIRHAR